VTLVSAQLKLDVTIPAEGGIELGAWLFLREGDGIRPAITMAHGFGGTREHGLERFAQAFAAAGFVVLVHDHRNFGMSAGTSAGTSIHGNKLRTGVAQFLTLRAARKLIRPVLVYGAPAMPADTLSCLAQQIGACAALLPRFQQSAVTSRACDGSHLTPRPHWSTLSTRTREAACAESCRAARQLLAATSPFLPPTARRMRSISIFSPFRKVFGKTN